MHLIALEQEPTSLRGGQELNLLEICHQLAKRGHRITLLHERPGNLLDQYREFCDQTIKVNSYGFDRRRIGDVVNFLPSLASLTQIPFSKDSIIFSNVYHTVFYGYLLSLYRKIPLVCYLQVPPFDFNRQRLLGLKNVDKFISVSHQTKLNWVNAGYDANKIDVVLNGTDTEKFKPAVDREAVRSQWQIPADTKVISYIGRLDKEKGVETLLQAFALMIKNGMKAQLLIAGSPVLHVNPEKQLECVDERKKYQQSLFDLTTRLGIDNQVNFLGRITNTPELYQASDVTVVPSRWPDPCPRVVLEAMSAGTPLVASKIGGIPEVLTGEFTNHLVEPDQPAALAETLGRVIGWREQDPSLGQRCRQHIINHFSINSMIDGIEESLLQLLTKQLYQVA